MVARVTLAVALLTVTTSAVGCRRGGRPNDELVGTWKAAEVSGGDTWRFGSDGEFDIGGGQRPSLDGSGRLVPNLMRSGTWAERNGMLTLTYTVPKDEKPAEYRWAKTGHKLELTRAGASAPEAVLERTEGGTR